MAPAGPGTGSAAACAADISSRTHHSSGGQTAQTVGHRCNQQPQVQVQEQAGPQPRVEAVAAEWRPTTPSFTALVPANKAGPGGAHVSSDGVSQLPDASGATSPQLPGERPALQAAIRREVPEFPALQAAWTPAASVFLSDTPEWPAADNSKHAEIVQSRIDEHAKEPLLQKSIESEIRDFFRSIPQQEFMVPAMMMLWSVISTLK